MNIFLSCCHFPAVSSKSLSCIILQRIILYSFVAIALFIPDASGQLTSQQIDSLALSCLKTFRVAGAAIAVVKDGKVIHSKGYGVKNIKSGEAVDENTNFAIASNTKAFTAAALAILVERGKLKWEDKVIQYVPEFKMYDDYVTKNFNIKDLLTHRSGLGLGVGDLMMFPDGTDFTIKDVATFFQYFKPVSAFRTQFDYDNMLYLIAGEVIKRISGTEWHTFIENNIISPLGMNHTYCHDNELFKDANIAMPHNDVNGKCLPLPHFRHIVNGAAGGIASNVNDLSKWLLLQLNKGRYGDALQYNLFSEGSQREMWQIHTTLPTSKPGRYNTHFNGYGLGWFLSDKKGNMVVEHTGGLPGMLSKTMLIPDLNMGLVVLTNTEPGGGAMFNAMSQSIMDAYLHLDAFDWIKAMDDRLKSSTSTSDSVTVSVWKSVESNQNKLVNTKPYLGMYEDKWFGKIEVFSKEGRLWIRALRSPKLNGPLQYFKDDIFAVKWEYQDMNADALVTFEKNKHGKVRGMAIKGISPNIDFSFDFQDLNPVKILTK
jgi:CubicO group peptidase (beta-lactamase class C family)